MTIQKITIPKRDFNGYLVGFRKINVVWKCPTCGGKMGEPQLTPHAEDGFYGSIHTWENQCGHITKYGDLKEHKQ
ncbi:hypothetical protein [Bacillus pumilus]|uniref:hypothetical protein n=1 Tax=Bacillus pumilus TaxID=1408 RepID=UPI0011E8E04E|nr:hypothetical protein [Bacillus pumilus]TYS40526.1 hypothetical protein FZC68_17115 [Bacillus pumilus]